MFQFFLRNSRIQYLIPVAAALLSASATHAAGHAKEKSCRLQLAVHSSILKAAESEEDTARKRRMNRSAEDHRLMDVAVERFRAKIAQGESPAAAKTKVMRELAAECRERQGPVPDSGQLRSAEAANEGASSTKPTKGAEAPPASSRYTSMSPASLTCEDKQARCQQANAGKCSNYSQDSAPWKQCMSSSVCEPSFKACVSERDALDRSVEEVQRTGGPKPPNCPAGWDAEPRKNSRVGAFRCWGGASRLPADFNCPPGLVRTDLIGGVECAAPRK